MELEFVIENKIKREKLPKPIHKMVDEELNLIISKENWTTAAALSRLAFWDERRSLFIRKQKQKGAIPGQFIDEAIIDMINKALLPH